MTSSTLYRTNRHVVDLLDTSKAPAEPQIGPESRFLALDDAKQLERRESAVRRFWRKLRAIGTKAA